MPEKKAIPAETPIFNEEEIKTLHQLFKDKVREVMRLQSIGELPYASRLPVSVVGIREIMIIMNRSKSTAHRIMDRIYKKLEKQPDEYLSVKDFCKGTGLDEHTVQRVLDMCT